MTLVVDASVALKWVLEEEGADRAEALIGREALIAPDFLLIECVNVLTKEQRRGALTQDRALRGLHVIEAARLRLIPGVNHIHRALSLSLDLRASAYDCLYLALALAEGCPLITADDRFCTAVQTAYPQAIRRL